MTSSVFRCLSGMRVVDLSRYLPGPLATLWLADFGAEVIKIEPPGGEGMRVLGPRDHEGRGLWHAALNAGKQVLELDLAQEQGLSTLRALLTEADVLVESFRPGVLDRMGLSPAQLRASHPRLVIASLSGYGQEGPLRDAAGHDNNYLARSGLLAGIGPSPTQPTLVSPPLADCLGSLFGLSSILAALLARERDGEKGQGCHIDLALADVAMPLQAFALAETSTPAVPARRGEGLLSGGWACYGIYRAACGREFTLGAVEPKFWRAFCHAAGKPEWIARQNDELPQTSLRAQVQAWFQQQDGAALERRFEQVDCCLAPVMTLKEALMSPHHQARGLTVPADDGGGVDALFPVRVDGQTPLARRRRLAADT